MKILVDGDSCPVKDIIIETAQNYSLDVVFVASTDHIIKQDSNKVKVIVVDAFNQSADIRITNESEEGDIVLTNDYGLASLVLTKGCYSMSFNGYIYNNDKINHLLFKRHLVQKLKKKKNFKFKGPKKRAKEDDIRFRNNLENIIKKH